MFDKYFVIITRVRDLDIFVGRCSSLTGGWGGQSFLGGEGRGGQPFLRGEGGPTLPSGDEGEGGPTLPSGERGGAQPFFLEEGRETNLFFWGEGRGGATLLGRRTNPFGVRGRGRQPVWGPIFLGSLPSPSGAAPLGLPKGLLYHSLLPELQS